MLAKFQVLTCRHSYPVHLVLAIQHGEAIRPHIQLSHRHCANRSTYPGTSVNAPYSLPAFYSSFLRPQRTLDYKYAVCTCDANACSRRRSRLKAGEAEGSSARLNYCVPCARRRHFCRLQMPRDRGVPCDVHVERHATAVCGIPRLRRLSVVSYLYLLSIRGVFAF